MAARPTTAPGPVAFTGFADPSLRFFHELDAHQDRAWFLAHKTEYEAQWAQALAALLAQVSPRIARFYKGLPLREPKVFRLQRDVRFSMDKSPYAGSADWLVDRAEETAPVVQKLARLLDG